MSPDLINPTCVFVLIAVVALAAVCINNGMSVDDRDRRYRNVAILGIWLVVESVTFAIYMVAWQNGHSAGASGRISQEMVLNLTWTFLAGFIGGFCILFFAWAKLTPEIEEALEETDRLQPKPQ